MDRNGYRRSSPFPVFLGHPVQDIDSTVLETVKAFREAGKPVHDYVIRQWALNRADEINVDFTASNNWLDGFKRHGIKLKKVTDHRTAGERRNEDDTTRSITASLEMRFTLSDSTEIADESHYQTPQANRRASLEEGSSSQSEEDTIVQSRPITRSQARQLNNDEPAVIGVHERALFTLDDEPRTLKDAQESDDWDRWQEAMREEIEALEKNKTWILVDRPPNVKPIKNKWVYKIKLTPNSQEERYKARLVAKGYTQIENVDYKETYVPVASMNTFRLFLQGILTFDLG
jgi:hypothetical protein